MWTTNTTGDLPQPKDPFAELKKEAIRLVNEGKVVEAIEIIEQFDPEIAPDLLSKHKAIERDQRMGIVDPTNSAISRKILTKGIKELCKEVSDKK